MAHVLRLERLGVAAGVFGSGAGRALSALRDAARSGRGRRCSLIPAGFGVYAGMTEALRGRVWRVEVGYRTTVFDVSELDITFDVKKAEGSKPNKGNVSIF